LARLCAVPIEKTVPRLREDYAVKGRFTFQQKPAVSRPRHSILCLDVSGSMTKDYPTLAQAANDYITIQRQRNGLISIVQFNDNARILYEQMNRCITAQEGFTGGGTNFSQPLQKALELANRNPSGYECRIVFFTDGQASIPSVELQSLQKAQIRMDVVGCGSVRQDILTTMVTCGGQVSIGATINEVGEVFRQIAATD
jgi:Mg-chelatase subunit ChlD